MKVGDLVQVLPAKIGYYLITGRVKMDDLLSLSLPLDRQAEYWYLTPLDRASFQTGGPMDEKFIEVISEGR